MMELIKTTAKKWINRPFFPFVFTALFVLILYIQNLSELYSTAVLRPLLAALVIAGALFVDVNRRVKNSHKAGLIVSALGFAFFLFGPMREISRTYLSELPLLGQNIDITIAVILVLFAILITVYAVRSENIGPEKTRMFNVIALVLLLFNLFTYINHVISFPDHDVQTPSAVASFAEDSEKRDVYYLVFDRYANQETLQREMDFSNEDFLGFLEQKGFTLNNDAYANYQVTSHSLASSLTMRYLDEEAKKIGPKSNTLLPVITLMRNSLVGQTYRHNGYKYLHAGSWWDPTRFSEVADETLTPITMEFFNLGFELTEFERLLLSNSLAQPVVDRGVVFGDFQLIKMNTETHRQQGAIFNKQMDYIAEAARRPEPTFTFVHSLMPHPPYVFLADGTVVDPRRKGPENEKYLEQLKYTNGQIETAIEAILNNSETEPIIIIQADEGPYPKNRGDINWHETDVNKIKMKTGILQALYLPGLSEDKKREITELTPVNLHRAVMNTYFNAGYELLPDEHYLFSEGCCKYDFKNVTELLHN